MSPKGKKRDTWEPCVTPLKKDQVVDKKGGRKKVKEGKGKREKNGWRNEEAISDKATIKTRRSKMKSLSTQRELCIGTKIQSFRQTPRCRGSLLLWLVLV